MTKSEEMYINSREETEKAALEKSDIFLAKFDISRKEFLHLRLLAEETVGMVKAMTDDFMALFWIEEDEGRFSFKVMAKTEMNTEKKKEILSVSSTGKNASAKGFMGKISELIENSLMNYDEVMKLQQKYGSGYVDYVSLGMGVPGEIMMTGEPMTWSLSQYKAALKNSPDSEEAKEAWDELEKSIVASLAKEVTVGVKKDRVDMTIIA